MHYNFDNFTLKFFIKNRWHRFLYLILYLLQSVRLSCGSAGIGRQARLRILWPLGRVGSSPIFRSSLKVRKSYYSRLPVSFAYRYFLIPITVWQFLSKVFTFVRNFNCNLVLSFHYQCVLHFIFLYWISWQITNSLQIA